MVTWEFWLIVFLIFLMCGVIFRIWDYIEFER